MLRKHWANRPRFVEPAALFHHLGANGALPIRLICVSIGCSRRQQAERRELPSSRTVSSGPRLQSRRAISTWPISSSPESQSLGIFNSWATVRREALGSLKAPPLLRQRKPYLTGSPPSRQEADVDQMSNNPSITRDRRDVRTSVPQALSLSRLALSVKFPTRN